MVALTRTPEQTQAQTLYKLTHARNLALLVFSKASE